MSLPEIILPAHLRPHLEQGHPWVYRDQIPSGSQFPSGTWVRLRCGPFVGIGLWDARSPIGLRLFRQHAEAPTNAWFEERVWEAWASREFIRAGATNAYRWIYGEGDGLPGLTIDRYGDYALAQTYAESVEMLAPIVARAMRSIDPDLRGVAIRESNGGLRALWGELPPPDLVIEEHGLRFHADLARGQKTGLFLDQRENRRTLEGLVAGREVLNCFSYTGGFSLYALRGGAAHVTSADIGQGLAEATTANLQLNHLPLDRHSFITEDCFALIERCIEEERRFQVVILDPPSFAKSKQQQANALRAYTRLNSLALKIVEEGGFLVSASCTSQISPEAFRGLLGEAAARSRVRLSIQHEAGHAADHPVPAGFPEGRYLKFVVGRVWPRT